MHPYVRADYSLIKDLYSTMFYIIDSQKCCSTEGEQKDFSASVSFQDVRHWKVNGASD